MLTVTKTVSNVGAGKSRLNALIDFPSKDATVTGTYLIEISFNSGVTWRNLCGGQIRGNFVPITRPADPANPILFSVSHNGVICDLRGTLIVSKVDAANFTVN